MGKVSYRTPGGGPGPGRGGGGGGAGQGGAGRQEPRPPPGAPPGAPFPPPPPGPDPPPGNPPRPPITPQPAPGGPRSGPLDQPGSSGTKSAKKRTQDLPASDLTPSETSSDEEGLDEKVRQLRSVRKSVPLSGAKEKKQSNNAKRSKAERAAN